VTDRADTSIRALQRTFLHVDAPALVPEVKLWLASELVPLWSATEEAGAAPGQPPFWAYAWPGSQVLARYVLDRPEVVAGKRVLDFGAGSGLAAIAAVQAGAAQVLATDLDPLAMEVQGENAALNGVAFDCTTRDLSVDGGVAVDVVLAGDVWYEREPAARHLAWLRALAGAGCAVWLADPGRAYGPRGGEPGLELVGAWEVATLFELESRREMHTRLWRLRGAGAGHGG
jgi:predicted nicotinamide N-methyase